MATNLNAAVARGILFLDAHLPGWRADVGTASLTADDMSASCACILGRTKGNYWQVVDQVCGPANRYTAATETFMATLGFTLEGARDSDENLRPRWRRLANAWNRALNLPETR